MYGVLLFAVSASSRGVAVAEYKRIE